MKKVIFFLMLFLILGCNSKNKPKQVTITVQMFEGPEYNAMAPTAKYWNKKYAKKTGITVKAISLSRVSYLEKIETQLVAGMEQDIIHPFSMYLERLKPHLEPLDSYLKDKEIMTAPNGEKLSLDSMFHIAWKTVISSDGKKYMIPKDMSEQIIYYRKDLIRNPPQTWDEFLALGKKFTRSINPKSPTPYGLTLAGKYELWTFCTALEFIWSHGGQIFKKNSYKPDLDSENVIKALRFYEEIAKNKILPPGIENAEHDEVELSFKTGKVAMILQWNATYYNLPKDKFIRDKFAIAPPPGVRQKDGSIKRTMYLQTICLALNKNSKHKKEAMRFLAWATLGEGAVLYAKHGGSSPIRQVWKAKDASMPYPSLAPWVEKYGKVLPTHPKIS